jgi:hypothetical protein
MALRGDIDPLAFDEGVVKRYATADDQAQYSQNSYNQTTVLIRLRRGFQARPNPSANAGFDGSPAPKEAAARKRTSPSSAGADPSFL